MVGDGDEVEALVDALEGLVLLTPDCVDVVEAGELEVDEVGVSKPNVF